MGVFRPRQSWAGSVRTPDAVHNLSYLALAAAGVAMLCLALLDWILHPMTLWLTAP